MQAIIMAAGKGSRISDLSTNAPKCYLEINGKRLLDHQLDILEANGITDIIIVVGYMKERIKSDYSGRGITFVENPFFGAINVLSSFWFALPNIIDDFIYLHADTIFEREIFDRMMKTDGSMVLPVDFKKCGAEEMKVEILDGSIAKINKTMSSKIADGEFIGIAKISKSLLPQLKIATDDILFAEHYNSFFESAIQFLIDKHNIKVTPIDITGLAWNEIDFKEDYDNTKLKFA